MSIQCSCGCHNPDEVQRGLSLILSVASDKIHSWFQSFAIFLPAEDFDRVPHSASRFSLSLSYPHDGSTSIAGWGMSCQPCPEFSLCSQPVAGM